MTVATLAVVVGLGLGAGCGSQGIVETEVATTPSDVIDPKPSAPAPAPAPTPDAAKAEQAPAPEAAVTAPDSKAVLTPITYADYRAKGVVKPEAKLTIVDAWATWCGPCKENFPHLVAMHKTYADKGLNVISLSLDDRNDAKALENARTFLTESGATFTNYLLDEDFDLAFEKLGVVQIPAVFLYGPDGKELRRFTLADADNQFTYAQVEEVVKLLLDGKPLPDKAPGEAPPAETAKP
jgi:thiol-disulfide isomerase/thioredoxin